MANVINESQLFKSISNDISSKGYSIHPFALPEYLCSLLSQQLARLPKESFDRAGIGRGKKHIINDVIRTDEVCWISNNNEAGSAWIRWTESLKLFLNRHLFLGLFSFESHFSHYAKGDFYKIHKDAFKGESNRVLSVIVYLNRNWSDDDGGELIIYDQSLPASSDIEHREITVIPNWGTIVIFLSEEFPHQVLAAERDRYSIAGWFRLHTSHN